MKRPWNKWSDNKPWLDKVKEFGVTRYETPEYNTRRWQRLRRQQLTIHPTCAMCELIGITTAAVMVDHIKPISQGGDFWDENNLQSLCNHCHRIKTNREISKRAKR